MKIDFSKEELQELRELLWEGRSKYAKDIMTSLSPTPAKMVNLGTKYIRKVNTSLKKVHGHDCCGDRYI